MTNRTMLTLPALARSSGSWRLPLCDSTALALANSLLEPEIPTRAQELVAALWIDPAFAIWAVCQATTDAQSSLPSAGEISIESLASWLAPKLAQLLEWPRDQCQVSLSAEQHSRFAALVAESIGPAHEIVRSLSPSEAFSQPIYLAALTAHWGEWLAAANQLGADTVAELPFWPLKSPPVSDALSPESRAASDEAWRRWLIEVPAAQSLLPRLIAQQRQFANWSDSFAERLQTAKLDALKEFAYGAGHELNNPLANIATRAQTLLKEETHPERRRRLAAINTQAFRAHEMLADMMLFARPPQLSREPTDLVPLASDVLNGLSEAADAQNTMLHGPKVIDSVIADVDPVQFRVALRALCMNSLEALGSGGNVTVEVKGSASTVLVMVTDDGPGISSETRDKIFDPFFSGREAGRGLGFGLSKCWRIVNLHGGRIVVESRPGHGATFSLIVPATQEKCAAV